MISKYTLNLINTEHLKMGHLKSTHQLDKHGTLRQLKTLVTSSNSLTALRQITNLINTKDLDRCTSNN